MVSDVTLALCGRKASGCVLMAKVVQTSRHAIRNYHQQEKYCSFEFFFLKMTAPHEVSKDAVISPVTSELLHRMQWMSLKRIQLYSYQGLRRTQGLLYQKYLCGKATMAPDATVTFKPQYFTVPLRKHNRIYVWRTAKEVEVHCWFGNNFSKGLAELVECLYVQRWGRFSAMERIFLCRTGSSRKSSAR